MHKVQPENFFRVLGLMMTFAILALKSTASLAHPLAPSLLQITDQGNGQAEVIWKTPLAKIPGKGLQAQLPQTCRRVGEVETTRNNIARIETWRMICEKSWVGGTVGVTGFSSIQPNVILRVVLANGLRYQHVLNVKSPSFVIPPRALAWEVFKDYLDLGMKHILSGWDHLLFVLGLVLLVKGRSQLLRTITAFTLGHSVTLSLAVLGWVHVPSAPVETLIALSILILAAELLRKQNGQGTFFHRYPWGLAFGFGLLHGLGFAGALVEAGLPVGEIPLALLSFNLGIESGQLLFIGAILLLRLIHLPIPQLIQRMEILAYAIGSMAAFWFFERISKI